jgi:DNA-binding transcriptional LysR family regulator
MLKQLRYLAVLAGEKHFGRAAAVLNISQPTLSAAIRQLEQELGVPLVERSQRFRDLTPEGRCVVEHATRMVATFEEMRQSLEEMSTGLSGRLRLGAIPTAMPVVSLLTTPFHARYPRVTVTVLSQTSQEIERKLAEFELEVGLTYLDNEPLDHVRAKPVYNEEYVFLTGRGGAFAGRDEITWEEASRVPLCLLTPDMQNRRIVDGVFRSVGVSPQVAVETNSIFNLCSHAGSGVVSSIVPRPLLQFFGMPRGARAIELVAPRVAKSVGLIIADRDPAPPLARRMFESVTALDLDSSLSPMVQAG